MRGLSELRYNEALKHSTSDFLIGGAASCERPYTVFKKYFKFQIAHIHEKIYSFLYRFLKF